MPTPFSAGKDVNNFRSHVREDCLVHRVVCDAHDMSAGAYIHKGPFSVLKNKLYLFKVTQIPLFFAVPYIYSTFVYMKRLNGTGTACSQLCCVEGEKEK